MKRVPAFFWRHCQLTFTFPSSPHNVKRGKGKERKIITYFFDNQLQHHLRRWSQIVYLQILGLVQTVLWGERSEQAVGTLVQRHGPIWMRVHESSRHVVGCLQVREAIAQHVGETRWLLALAVRAISTGVFCFLGEEVQEDLVVGEERRLGRLDLAGEGLIREDTINGKTSLAMEMEMKWLSFDMGRLTCMMIIA